MSSLIPGLRKCRCGSGLYEWALKDVRNIFCAYVCDKCKTAVKGRYRPEIFTDPDYWTTENVE